MMTEAEMQTAVSIIRHGWADRVLARVAGTVRNDTHDFAAIEDRVRRALPAITNEDLAAAVQRAGKELAAEADELRRFLEARRP